MVSRRDFIKKCLATGVGMAALPLGLEACASSASGGKMDKSSIFEETEMNHLKLKNRLFRSATWENMAEENGKPTPELIDLYEELAKGGVGTIITGCTCIEKDIPYLPKCMRMWTDDFIPAYQELTNRVKKYHCNILSQLSLDKYLRMSDGAVLDVDDLTKEDINEIVRLFRDATVRAQKAGFSGVQVLGAHGYILYRSMTPLYNHRTDEYGGAPRNRTRLTTEVIDAIKKACPDMHLCMKMHFPDGREGGNTEQDMIEICRILEKHGVDSIETSGARSSRPAIKAGRNEAYFLEFTKFLKQSISIPVICVGGIRSYEFISQMIEEGSADYASLCRPLIQEPGLPERWRKGDLRPASCISCNRCFSMLPDRHCVFNIPD